MDAPAVTARAAVPLLVATFLCALAAVPLSVGSEPVTDTVFYAINSVVLSAVGALLVRRHRGHALGWVLLALGLQSALSDLVEGYGYHSAWPGALVAAWIAAWASYVGIGATGVVLALFPSGRPADRGSRALLWLTLTSSALMVLGAAFGHLADDYFRDGRNPYPIGGEVLTVAGQVGTVLFGCSFVLAVVVLVVRFRRATGIERQQLKWIAYAVGLLGVVGPLALAFYWDSIVVRVLISVVVTAFPVAVGAAILRYRLYDIDLLINRTLVYLALTVLLGSVYLGLVLLGQLVLAPVTSGSGVAVAVSTLAVAALFRPARRAIQAVVDRRFYRSRYDARRTVDAFTGRLRDELDLRTVESDLTTTVSATLRPAAVSVWLSRGR